MASDSTNPGETLPWLPFFLQTADALFPTGAYAHSLGFEEAVRLGVVRNADGLLPYLLEHIVPAQREHELPYLRFSFAAAVDGNLAELRRIDREISAWKLAPEAREASAQLGRRRLRALQNISDRPLLAAFDTLIERSDCQGHHLTVCGLQAALEGVPMEAALAAYFYQSLASVCGAALKLIRVGQNACQRALRESAQTAQQVIQTSLSIQRHDAGWFSPILEVSSLRHLRAEERLFIS